MSAFNMSFSGGSSSGGGEYTDVITSLVPPTDTVGKDGNLYIQFGIGGERNKQYYKQYGAWYQISGPRNSSNFNGSTQYAVVPPITEIDTSDENFGIEVEWLGALDSGRTILFVTDDDTAPSSFYSAKFCIYRYLNNVFIALGGESTSVDISASGLGGSGTYGLFSVVATPSSVEVKLNGERIGYSTVVTIGSKGAVVDTDVMEIGRGRNSSSSSGLYYQGKLSNLRIWTGGDRNTGTLTRDYRMDEGWRGDNNQVLVNYATELGDELVTIEQPFDSAPMTQAGQWLYTDTLSPNALDTTVTYLATITVTNYLASSSQSSLGYGLNEWDADTSTSRIGDGDIVFTGTPARARPQLYTRGVNNDQPNQCTWSNHSIKQADGYGTYVGFTEASWTEEEM